MTEGATFDLLLGMLLALPQLLPDFRVMFVSADHSATPQTTRLGISGRFWRS